MIRQRLQNFPSTYKQWAGWIAVCAALGFVFGVTVFTW